MKLRHAATAAFGALAVLVISAPPASAHPLGNFTVNHYDGLTFGLGRVNDLAVIDSAEIPTSQLVDIIDAGGNGRTTAAERAAYARTQCASLARAVRLSADGRTVAFTVDASSFSFRPGAANLDISRLECELSAPLDLRRATTVSFSNNYQSDRIGWHEIVVSGNNVHFKDLSVPTKSVSDQLRKYPNDLLSSPLDVRNVRIQVLPGPGLTTFAPGVDVASSANRLTRTVEQINVAFNDLVGRRDLTLQVGLLAIACRCCSARRTRSCRGTARR